MADNYTTMKRTGVIPENEGEEYGPLRPYECEVCHGVSLDRCQDPGELTCSLCDESAPLRDRYCMAMHTLGWLCLKHGKDLGHTILLRFGSLEVCVVVIGDTDFVEAKFKYKDATVCACSGGFNVKVGGKEEVLRFADSLDTGGDKFTPRILAQEVVDRVRHDLKLKYGENAGLETPSLQGASAKGVEA